MATFIDLFSGIGGFRKGLELAGHSCIGYCESDHFPDASYRAIHLATDSQLEFLKSLKPKQRVREIVKDEYRNGEWYEKDIRDIKSGDIPKANIWCFGFPCQDISSARSDGEGLSGKRSGLFYTVTSLIEELEEEDRPHTLLIENVKNIFNVNGGRDFARVLIELDNLGYDAEWQLFNSKNFGVPQNRERVFIVGHSRRRSWRSLFPIIGNTTGSIKFFQGDVNGKGQNSQQDRVYGVNGILACIPASRTITKVKVLIGADREDMKIRSLTPLECWRCQDWDDESFRKAEIVNSNTQLYTQAGNGVTVSIVQAIGEKMNEVGGYN